MKPKIFNQIALSRELIAVIHSVLQTWLNEGILSRSSLAEIARLARLIQVPAGYQQIHHQFFWASKLISGEHGSQYTLQLFLKESTECPFAMLNVVCACMLNSQPACYRLVSAKLLLMNYCKIFQVLYGEESCTMNHPFYTYILKTYSMTLGHHIHSGVIPLKGIMAYSLLARKLQRFV